MGKQRVLITGVGGFIGHNLFEGLKDDFDVVGLKHADLDLTNEKQVKTFISGDNFDVIIHCAVAGITRPSGTEDNGAILADKNLRMFFNLVESIHPDMHLIYFGSGAEFNKKINLQKVSENDLGMSLPLDGYGFTKYIMARYAEKSDHITCLRIFGLYGKYEDYAYKFISNSIVKNILRLPITINQNVIFDYLFVDDLVTIVKQMIRKKPKFRSINVTPTESVDLLSIVSMINEVGSESSPTIVLKEGYNLEYTGDNKRLVNEMGETFRFTSYKTGIARLFHYYEAISDQFDLDVMVNDPYLKYTQTRNYKSESGY